MAKFTKDEFIKGISEMTILELKELVDAMKDELGIDATAVAVAAPAAGAVEDTGSSTKTIVLKSAGGNKIAVIKILKEITGLGLVEAKALAEKGGTIKEALPKDEAEKLVAKFKEAGATVVAE